MANHPDTVTWTRYRREVEDLQRLLALAKAEAEMWQGYTWHKLKELGAHFGSVEVRSADRDIEVSAVVGLIDAMWTLVAAEGALRGAPSEDTMRVGSGTMLIDGESVAVTAVERAALSQGRLQWLRKKVHRTVRDTTNLIHNELEGTRAEPADRGRRCRNPECEQYNRAWQKTPHCGYCTEPIDGEAA